MGTTCLLCFTMLPFILAVCLTTASALPAKGPRLSFIAKPQIIGGEDVAANEIPHQLSMQVFGGHNCGASLVNAKWALTACHCTQGNDPADVEIVAGANTLSDDTEDRQTLSVESINDHPSCDTLSPGVPYDFSMLKLTEAADTSKPNIAVVPVPANGTSFIGNNDCWISGWGRPSGIDSDLSDKLQKANVDVLTNADCKTRMSNVGGASIDPYHICVTDTTNQAKGSCNGDSGGPLSCKVGNAYQVAGVTSWGVSSSEQDCLTTYPSVYARVSYVDDWINGLINGSQ